MKITPLHGWDLTPKEAVVLQRELAGRVDRLTHLPASSLVAGADVSYNRFSPICFAAVVVLRTSDWTIVETQTAVRQTTFPYVPGLLTFREAPVLLEAFAKLQCMPDAVIFDGQGIAHPRRLGLTSHVGLWLDLPCAGCAKSLLVGTFKEPARKGGSRTRLLDQGEVVGSVLRTRDNVKPVFVSIGHKIDLQSAVRLVLRACRGYRLPEPTRQAHLVVNAVRRRFFAKE
jgi:deoxyribonuclease V